MDRFMYETSDTKLLKAVYEHLQDAESIDIYNARSLFSLSDNSMYMKDVIGKMPLSIALKEFISNNKGKKLMLFGAGTWGQAIIKHIDIEWDYVVDNNRAGSTIEKYQIKRFEEVNDIEDTVIVLAILFKYKEVLDRLLSMGIKKENVLILGRLATDLQYFDLNELRLSQNEVYVDAGGFNGDTALRFSQVVENEYDEIYVFEPNKQIFNDTKINLHYLHDCKIYNKAVWSKECELQFIEAGEGTRVIENTNDEECVVQAISIDQVLDGKRATYIKMDIEGSEYEALLGAQDTIKTYKPKLAISVYHKRDDIWEIPKLLLKMNPEYKFYLRMYSFTGNDTVLYAIPS